MMDTKTSSKSSLGNSNFGTRTLLQAFCLLLYLQITVQNSPPLLVLPKVLHLHAKEQIALLSTQNTGLEPQRLRLEICDASIQSDLLYNKQILLLPGSNELLSIQLAQYPKFGKVTISLKDDFSKILSQNTLEVKKSNGISLIQLDKPIYTPDQNVKIRMLRMDRQMRPIRDDFRIQISNPQNIIMENVRFTKDQQQSFFVDHTFKIPPAPIFGIWKVVLQQDDDLSYNSTFEVREYVLPTFHIEMNATNFILPSTRQLEGNCRAMYVFGQPVNGTVSFKFGYRSESTSKVSFVGRTNYKSLVNGEAQFSFKADDFYKQSNKNFFFGSYRFVVEAEVNEYASGHKMKHLIDESRFVSKICQVSLKNSINDFKPGLETNFTAKILDVNNKPAALIAVELSVDELHLRKKLISDSLGQIQVPLLVMNESIDSLTIRISTIEPSFMQSEQCDDVHILRKFQNNGLPYMAIFGLKSVYQVEESAMIDLRTNGPKHLLETTHCFLSTLSGKLLLASKIDSNNQFKFSITQDMLPEFTLLCMGMSKLGSNQFQPLTTADSKRAKVFQKDRLCGLDVSFAGGSKGDDSVFTQFEPGSKATLTVRNGNGQYLSLIGIDEAVLVLTKNGIVYERFMDNLQKQLEISCGAGGGIDSSDVLFNSGFIILGSTTELTQSPLGSHCTFKKQIIPERPPKTLTRIVSRKRYGRSIDDDDEETIQTDRRFTKRHLFRKSSTNSTLIKLQQMFSANEFQGHEKKCCMLALRQHRDTQQWDCLSGSMLLAKYMKNDTECIEAYLHCCSHFKPKSSEVLEKGLFARPALIASISNSPTDFVHIAYEEDYEAVSKIRQDFRETWLFNIVALDQSEKNITFKLPDSITTLSLSMVSLSESRGLCVFNQKPLRIRLFKPLFMQVHLPYKAVQNEQLEMVVSIFNYNVHPISLLLYYYGVDGICSEARANEKSERNKLIIEPNNIQSVSIPLIPLHSGHFSIQVVALSTFGTDVVIKMLRVVPQGIAIEDDYSFQLDPKNRQKRRKRLISTRTFYDNIYPDENRQVTKLKLIPNQKQQLIVPNSEHCIISAIADEFGPAIKYTISDSDNMIESSNNEAGRTTLDHLIRKPRGCGEQTAFYYAPTLYTLKYLQYTQKLSKQQHEKANGYLQAGYKRQMMFRKDDGSFSAFPNRPSSVWLTAFLTRLFCQSEKHIKMDSKVLNSALIFLMRNQNTNGYWSETYPVLHKQLIGGITGRLQLASYILSALRDCENVESVAIELNSKLQESMGRAEHYLLINKQELLRSNNAYKMALMAYSFLDSKNQDSVSLQLLNRLADLALVNKDSNMITWNDEYPVEVASYVLLTIAGIQRQQLIQKQKKLADNNQLATISISSMNVTSNETDIRLQKYFQFLYEQSEERQRLIQLQLDTLLKRLDAQSIVNFLTSQRTFSGGFDSTQDTILALNALAEYYRNQINIEQLEMQLNCNITTTGSRFRRSIEFNKENALVMRKVELNKKQLSHLIDEELQFDTTGNGYGVISVKLMYNVIAPEKLCKFDLDIELSDWREKSLFNRAQNSNTIPQKNQTDSSSFSPPNEKTPSLSSDTIEEEFLDEFPDELLKELNIKDKKSKKRQKRSLQSDFGKEFDILKAQDDAAEYELKEKISNFLAENQISQNVQTMKSSPIRAKRSTSDDPKPSPLVINSIRIANGSPDNMQVLDNAVESNVIVDNPTASRSVYKLKICTQHIPQYDSEMTIIEAGLLTGFTVDRRELDALVSVGLENNSAASLIAKYELTPRSVIFYLDSVPFARRICFDMKLVQTLQVSNIQSAVVKVYDYYKKDDICTSLYSPNRVVESLNITCSNVACSCAVDNNCPSEARLSEIGKIAEVEKQKATTKLRRLICDEQRFSAVFVGKIIAKKLLNGFILLRVQLKQNLRQGLVQDEKVVLTLNQECYSRLNLISSSDELLVFTNGTDTLSDTGDDEKLQNHFLNRNSIVFNLSSDLVKHSRERRLVHELIQDVIRLKQRLVWKCEERKR